MMANPTRVRPSIQRPFDPALGQSTNQFLDWVQTSLNSLLGQSIVQGSGINTLSVNGLDPSTGQISSVGSRPQSIVSPITYVIDGTGTQITFYWDGTHSSQRLAIMRDDGTTEPLITGKFTVTGLTSGDTYFFYPYFQESTSGNFQGTALGVQWARNVATAVGTPLVAHTAKDQVALATQIARDHIPLSVGFATAGVLMTPNATGNGGAGGGGAMGAGGALLG